MFTTVGKRLDDCCEHEHETLDEAQECLSAHQAQKRLRGQISYRVIVELESLDDIEEQY